MSNSNYQYLHELAIRHYERAEYNIAEHIKEEVIRKKNQRPAKIPLIRLLDIGSGRKSTLLKSLEQAFGILNYMTVPFEAEIYFLDIEQFEEIHGLQDEPYKISKNMTDHSYNGASFKAKFIEADFNYEVGTEKTENSSSFAFKSELDIEFDIIVLNFAIHEILDSSCIEFTDDTGKKRRLTTVLFLKKLFERIHRLLDTEGMVYFGDAYFPRYVSSQQTKQVLNHLNENFGHADSPSLFLHPEDIITTILQELKGKFSLCLDSERLTVIDKDCNLFRKSYFVGLKKL